MQFAKSSQMFIDYHASFWGLPVPRACLVVSTCNNEQTRIAATQFLHVPICIRYDKLTGFHSHMFLELCWTSPFIIKIWSWSDNKQKYKHEFEIAWCINNFLTIVAMMWYDWYIYMSHVAFCFLRSVWSLTTFTCLKKYIEYRDVWNGSHFDHYSLRPISLQLQHQTG